MDNNQATAKVIIVTEDDIDTLTVTQRLKMQLDILLSKAIETLALMDESQVKFDIEEVTLRLEKELNYIQQS